MQTATIIPFPKANPKPSRHGRTLDRLTEAEVSRMFAKARWNSPRTLEQQRNALDVLDGADLAEMTEFYRVKNIEWGITTEEGARA